MRFAFVGGGVTAAVYLAFRLLLRAGLDPVPASALCWLMGLGLGYVLNKRITFELRRDASVAEVATFLAGYGLQLVIGMAGYALLMKRWHVDATVSFMLVTGVTAAFSFLFMRFVVFRTARGAPA